MKSTHLAYLTDNRLLTIKNATGHQKLYFKSHPFLFFEQVGNPNKQGVGNFIKIKQAVEGSE